MENLQTILLLVVTSSAIWLFSKRVGAIKQSIHSGRKLQRQDNPALRLRNMLLVAFGQRKMFQRPIPALLHGVIYVGFLLINLEVLEMMIDGIFQTHRIFGVLGPVYSFLTAANEILGFLVIIVCVILLYRRNVAKVRRFTGVEMQKPQTQDANIILLVEIILMLGLFTMNSADLKMHQLEGQTLAGFFPISQTLLAFFSDNLATLHVMERAGWWFHILGILVFLNYLPYSKHFHIIMAFPNTYFYKTEPVGKLSTPEHVTHEIRAMLDPSYQVPVPAEGEGPISFGASDVKDLSWKSLLDGFSCTECGRCTSVCPANLTGKLLSPRKVVMNIRDRQEDMIYQRNEDTKLSGGYVSAEELWACTTCNACVQECPVNIDPVAPILEMRRFLVMEQSAAPASLNAMFANLENNGSPWAFPAADRFNWANDIVTVSKN
jgi:ferredoxin